MNLSEIYARVQPVMQAVQQEGDAALLRFTTQFDGVELQHIAVSDIEKAQAAGMLSNELKAAIEQAAANIRFFHSKQLAPAEVVETMPGVRCWRKSLGIERVGIYVPGGTAPLFSTVLMLAVPAQLAGCKEIVLCTPPQKDGTVHPAVLYSAQVAGVSQIFKAGGAQAVAAMTYGTESIPAVSKIFGPGNQYVTAAKMLAQQAGIPIDMPAGPSEVCVMADESANPKYVAADLLSQAEHGADSQVLLVATPDFNMQALQEELAAQLSRLPRNAMAAAALENSTAVVLANIEDMLALVNEYAAEHLIISMNNATAIAEQVINAGSVFIGHLSPESVGDYASGTNHTLPTNGYARMYSGVSIDSFVKKITYQQLTPEGLKTIAPTVIAMAEAEGLEAHANAVRVRL
ncbi:histidinol dehydrogenase [Phnomibacter sp.]|jgi:histidinol dehydrogenase (EC 1.1.1.23)|uniref:histidinol dehydrogenase n=1 Tax=Phnomibacter sp. TaxID=2836217 RepID=UPI002FDDC47E